MRCKSTISLASRARSRLLIPWLLAGRQEAIQNRPRLPQRRVGDGLMLTTSLPERFRK